MKQHYEAEFPFKLNFFFSGRGDTEDKRTNMKLAWRLTCEVGSAEQDVSTYGQIYCKIYTPRSGAEPPDRREKQALNTSQWSSKPKDRASEAESTIKLEKEIH